MTHSGLFLEELWLQFKPGLADTALSLDRDDGHMCLTGEERRPMVSPSGELEVDIPN